ncbi:hypothetical protein KFE25_013866 [Diacronema lutheri]|uniref:Phosphoribulokinase/uridine kinase domain-containing protein n=1 Tax=Diacronema lutheri TaxID=2081491 RepID=A0A8J5XDR2_DIALT|nr:hypothetical protein KFE25_013866 [Diacronema lutheri]
MPPGGIVLVSACLLVHAPAGTAPRGRRPSRARTSLPVSATMQALHAASRGLADELRARADASGLAQYWVGIAGGAGSGKSTLARAVRDALGPEVAVVLPMDGFHYTKAELDRFDDPALAHDRRGAPFTFDADSFVRRLAQLRAAGEGAWPSFDHAVGDPIEDELRLDRSHLIVLVEGSYLLLDEAPWSDAAALLDEAWFITVPEELARQRVAGRHARAWGWSLDQARARVESNDLPNIRLVAQCEARAHIVIAGVTLSWVRQR